MENIKKNPLSLQLNAEDFLPASNEEKQSLVVMRESVNFWKDGIRRLKKNKIAMVSFVFIIAIAIFAYLLPAVWPYSYSEQMKGSNNLKPFEYSASEQARIDAGEKVFPHILGTDRMGRDFAVRIMMGTRVSLSVGLIASVLVLIIGATYGAVAAFAGGWVDNIMMRITDILYTIPDILLIILLGMALKDPLDKLSTQPGFKWMQTLGPNMISIFIIFALLYWVGMARIDAGEKVFPHILGTDRMGRDFAVRIMMGTRVSLSVGLIASVLVLIIGATYGAVAAFAGGWVDNIMMRITDILYTIPDILLIILLGMALKDPLDALATKPGFKWMQTLGPNMISIFIIFALLYWVGMARIVRSQILILKESEYVTAARALGASSGRIIKKHLLTNCIGTLIVTTTLQIPASIFTESYLSFIGLGVAAPLPSLGSLATDAVKGMNTYPHLLIAPALMISVMILVFNLFGDGLRDAFDPKLKN